MNSETFAQWENKIAETARSFEYPPTPNIAGAVTAIHKPSKPAQRLSLAWTMIVVIIIVAGLLAVPPVRAAVIEFLQLGRVRIFLVEPTPTATPVTTPTGTPVPTPTPTPTPLTSVLQLSGQTTLSKAQQRVNFPIALPRYPAEIGPPSAVFLQNIEGPIVILVWLDPNQPDEVAMSLHILGPGAFAGKVQPQVIEETTVNGQPALWTTGPYLLQYQQGNETIFDIRRMIDGHVLIWENNGLTFRLETDLPLEEALRIAESVTSE